LGELVGGTASTISQIPGFVARNIGPLAVGRNLQGPQSSAEAFQRLGANYDVPWQRALGHGLGAGLDMMADPTMLAGVGAGNRAAAGAAESALARRLEQFAGPGLQDATRAAQVRATQPIAAQPGSSIARQLEAMAVDRPALQGPPTSIAAPARPFARLNAAFGSDMPTLRVDQLNSPSFNPNLPVNGLGTPSFGQGNSPIDRLRRMTTAVNGPPNY